MLGEARYHTSSHLEEAGQMSKIYTFGYVLVIVGLPDVAPGYLGQPDRALRGEVGIARAILDGRL